MNRSLRSLRKPVLTENLEVTVKTVNVTVRVGRNQATRSTMWAEILRHGMAHNVSYHEPAQSKCKNETIIYPVMIG